MPRATDIMPISAFTRAYQKVIRDLKKHGRPAVLTIDGKPALVIQDPAAFERLIEAVEAACVDHVVGESLADPRPNLTMDQLRKRLDRMKQRRARPVARRHRAA